MSRKITVEEKESMFKQILEKHPIAWSMLEMFNRIADPESFIMTDGRLCASVLDKKVPEAISIRWDSDAVHFDFYFSDVEWLVKDLDGGHCYFPEFASIVAGPKYMGEWGAGRGNTMSSRIRFRMSKEFDIPTSFSEWFFRTMRDFIVLSSEIHGDHYEQPKFYDGAKDPPR